MKISWFHNEISKIQNQDNKTPNLYKNLKNEPENGFLENYFWSVWWHRLHFLFFLKNEDYVKFKDLRTRQSNSGENFKNAN